MKILLIRSVPVNYRQNILLYLIFWASIHVCILIFLSLWFSKFSMCESKFRISYQVVLSLRVKITSNEVLIIGIEFTFS